MLAASAVDRKPSMIRTLTPKALFVGILAGALAVPVFHQAPVLLLHLAGQIPTFPWSMRPVPPLNVPTLLNQMFWGGMWGILFAAAAEAIPFSPGPWRSLGSPSP